MKSVKVLMRDRLALVVLGVILAVLAIFALVNRADINKKPSTKVVNRTVTKTVTQETSKVEEKLAPKVEEASTTVQVTRAQVDALRARLTETETQLTMLQITLKELQEQQAVIERRVPSPIPMPGPPGPTGPQGPPGDSPKPKPCRVPVLSICLVP